MYYFINTVQQIFKSLKNLYRDHLKRLKDNDKQK